MAETSARPEQWFGNTPRLPFRRWLREGFVPRAVYCIVEAPQGWVVRLNGSEFGPASSRALAVLAAIQAATKAHAQGLHAQVLLHLGERFSTIWVNGRNLMVSA